MSKYRERPQDEVSNWFKRVFLSSQLSLSSRLVELRIIDCNIELNPIVSFASSLISMDDPSENRRQ